MPSPNFGAKMPNFGGATADGSSMSGGFGGGGGGMPNIPTQPGSFASGIMPMIQSLMRQYMPQGGSMPPAANPNLSGFWNEKSNPINSATTGAGTNVGSPLSAELQPQPPADGVPGAPQPPVGGPPPGTSGFWNEGSNPVSSGANSTMPYNIKSGLLNSGSPGR